MTPERNRRMPRAAVVLALLLGCCAVAAGLNTSPVDLLVIEDDWRKQDGIGTERASASYAAAIELTLDRARLLLKDLAAAGILFEDQTARWRKLRQEWKALAGTSNSADPAWEDLWRRVHQLRREIGGRPGAATQR